ncbi:TPA: hypothetical protein NI771_006072 [Pseudomonas aeruginosa]|uniref:Uncharacterized protein n=1 Tax=Pseudomonas aeruginosa TaxID=287 RepID=A0A7I8E4S3_PSEAI|nr:hypothetical protein [Pseudomonas aeruginosa]BCL65583.1 hypothetical protein [Pseudomonas aeruginosa]HCF9557240.1 hypothetical protein [Pseudomonas aeruginosa]HCF9591874.1 hypothetical protein [Pseudomonas aeruginosa]
MDPSGAAGEQLVDPVDLDHVQGEGHRRRRRRGPGAVDPSGAAGEQLVDPVDLDHVQGMAIGAGGAEHLVPWTRQTGGE